jgi:hypothetical protein
MNPKHLEALLGTLPDNNALLIYEKTRQSIVFVGKAEVYEMSHNECVGAALFARKLHQISSLDNQTVTISFLWEHRTESPDLLRKTDMATQEERKDSEPRKQPRRRPTPSKSQPRSRLKQTPARKSILHDQSTKSSKSASR